MRTLEIGYVVPNALERAIGEERIRTLRLKYIDATRGTAMLFVFIAHFGNVYIRRNFSEPLVDLFEQIGMVASPTFMMISGVMLGYLHVSMACSFQNIRKKLLKRGLLLLTGGHVLIAMAHIPMTQSVKISLMSVYITDVIALNIIIIPLIVDVIGCWSRKVVGISLFFFSWIMVLFWIPESYLLNAVKDYLFGSLSYMGLHLKIYTFPVVPWLAFYLVSTCLGEQIAHRHMKGEVELLKQNLTKTILGFGGLSLLAMLIYWQRTSLFSVVSGVEFLQLFSPFQKFPPGPAYLMFYGAVGLAILFVLFRLETNGIGAKYVDIIGIVGRKSLFAFILQYYVYFVFFREFDFGYSQIWPFYLFGSASLIIFISNLWYHRGQWMLEKIVFNPE